MIYCVEDDNGIRELMIYTLCASGFDARGFAESGAFWQALQEEKPQLILLDIMLPGEDGMHILKRLRSQEATATVPVIMATAKGTEYDKVIGLDQGADDYLVKPFGMMEMVSRVKAVLRRAAPTERIGVLRRGGLELNPAEHTVRVDGQPVQLTLKEYQLLCLLMKNRGAVLTRDVLLENIWGYNNESETRTVDVHIRTLRQKLGADGALIETVRGVGYRMGEHT